MCDQNRLRSPTAEAVFRDDPRVEARSAGVREGAVTPVTAESLDWADVIFVMQRSQRNLIRKRFPEVYARKRIVCLYIDDDYDHMDPALIALLTARVEPYVA